NRLNNQPPTTAPTMPRALSRKNPSPVLLTSLLPMKPAIRPSTTHEMIDMVDLLSWPRARHVLLPSRPQRVPQVTRTQAEGEDRKSTRLNSSHRTISYAVFCLKKKKHSTKV